MSDERAKQDAEREEAAREEEQATAPLDDRPPHVPDPTAMTGNLDTSGTGGAGGHSELRNIAPIFDVAEAHDMAYAARAVDPNDKDVPEDHVTLSQGLSVVQGDPDADRQRVAERAQRAQQRLAEDPMSRNLSDRGTYVHDRRARDERAWAASVSDMGPATVIGPQELGESPVAPNSVIDNRPEDERSPEGQPTADRLEEQLPETPDGSGRISQEEMQGVQDNREAMTERRAEEERLESGQAEGDADAQEATTVQGEATPSAAPEEGSEAASEPETAAQEDSEAPGPKSEEPHAPAEDVKAPNKASSKTEWVEWAVACGADREEAGNMTRLELISKYSKLRPNER